MVSDNEHVVSPQIVSYIKKITLLDVSKITEFNIGVLMTMKWLHQKCHCWVVRMKKSPRWSVLNINITIKKIIRKLEKTYLPICRRQEIQVSKAQYLKPGKSDERQISQITHQKLCQKAAYILSIPTDSRSMTPHVHGSSTIQCCNFC